MKNIPPEIAEAYNPDIFEKKAKEVIKILSSYLQKVQSEKPGPVLPFLTPEDMLKEWDKDFTGQQNSELLLLTKLVEQSQHIHNPNFAGHQVTAPLPGSAVEAVITALLNNSSAVYEMSPVDSIMQKRVVEWMCNKIGFNSSGDGVLTSGGTLGNLTAMLAARQIKDDNVWQKGLSDEKYVILVSEVTHYSIERAAAIMGLGTGSVIKLPLDMESKIDVSRLDEIYYELIAEGFTVLALVANAASTATGCYDDFNSLADFCSDKHIWFHVDGAHGASALVSEKYSILLNGIERADSVVWDLHKMMLMPALVTGVLFKNGLDSYKIFLQEASYLFNSDPQSEWFNYAHRNLECTKDMMGTRPYMALKVYGEKFFEKYIDYVYELTRDFADLILKSDDFELAVMPESNIICFRYDDGVNNSDLLQSRIRESILKTEDYYLVQTKLFDKLFLRSTIINPLTEFSNLEKLLEAVRTTANKIKANMN